MLVWLGEKQIFLLNGLGRYAEAARRVDAFFSGLYQQAGNASKARLHMWRFRFLSLRGELLAAIASYHAGLRYYDALPAPRRRHLTLNLAYAYMRIGGVEDAQRYVEQVLVEAEPGSEVEGRGLALRAELLLETDRGVVKRLTTSSDDAGNKMKRIVRLQY